MDDKGCFSATCGGLRSQDITTANMCTIPKTVVEDVDGCKSRLLKLCVRRLMGSKG